MCGIALLADNSARVFEVYWAALRCGLMLTAVNHHLTPTEVAYIVRDCGAKALVVAGSLGPLAAAVGEEVPEVALRLAYGAAVPGFDNYDTALDGVVDEPLADEARGRGDALLLGHHRQAEGCATRAAGATHRRARRAVRPFGERSTASPPETVYLSPAPLYHAAPLRFSTLVQELGGTVVVMERFDAEGALAAIERYRATHSQWVPTMFVRMLKLPVRGARTLRRVVDAGGDPRRGAVPGGRQARDDRLVGPGDLRVLRRAPRPSA